MQATGSLARAAANLSAIVDDEMSLSGCKSARAPGSCHVRRSLVSVWLTRFQPLTAARRRLFRRPNSRGACDDEKLSSFAFVALSSGDPFILVRHAMLDQCQVRQHFVSDELRGMKRGEASKAFAGVFDLNNLATLVGCHPIRKGPL